MINFPEAKFFYLLQNYKFIQIIGIQHGGNFGFENMHAKQIDLKLSDKYIFWGSHGKLNDNHLPINLKKFYYNKKNNSKFSNIFYIGNTAPKYANRMLQLNCYNAEYEYFKHQKTIIQTLSKSFKDLECKYYHQTDWKNLSSFYRMKNSKKNFSDIMYRSKLNVFDVMSTGFLESMNANTPTIIFINNRLIKFELYAKDMIDQLVSSNIVFQCHNKFENFICENHDHIDNWWFLKKTQDVKNNFLKNFAYTDTKYLDKWINFFNCEL